MKKIDFAQAIAIVANIGVIAGIVFLGFELRQNTSAIRGTTIQSISEQMLAVNFVGVETPELRLAWRNGSSDAENLSVDDRDILGWYFNGVMRVMENRYVQGQLNTIDSEELYRVGGLGQIYRHAYFLRWWEVSKIRYPEDFVSWVDTEVIPRTSAIEAPLMLNELGSE